MPYEPLVDYEPRNKDQALTPFHNDIVNAHPLNSDDYPNLKRFLLNTFYIPERLELARTFDDYEVGLFAKEMEAMVPSTEELLKKYDASMSWDDIKTEIFLDINGSVTGLIMDFFPLPAWVSDDGSIDFPSLFREDLTDEAFNEFMADREHHMGNALHHFQP